MYVVKLKDKTKHIQLRKCLLFKIKNYYCLCFAVTLHKGSCVKDLSISTDVLVKAIRSYHEGNNLTSGLGHSEHSSEGGLICSKS